MDNNKFWMVLGSGVPVRRHISYEVGRTEAARLARMYKGQRFFVLEAVASCVCDEVHWTEIGEQPVYDVDDTPF